MRKIEEKDVDMENIGKVKTLKEFEKSATIQRRQKFKMIDDVLNDKSHDYTPPQAECSLEYTDSNKKITVEWKTNRHKQIHKTRLRLCTKISLLLDALQSL